MLKRLAMLKRLFGTTEGILLISFQAL